MNTTIGIDHKNDIQYKSNVLDNEFHLINIILLGLAIKGKYPFYADVKSSKRRRYQRVNFSYGENYYDTFQEQENDTPYLIIENRLFYKGVELQDFPLKILEGEENIWGSEKSWFFKKLPNQPLSTELRLNPINRCSNLRYRTGVFCEFIGCAFCQRMYAHQRSSEKRNNIDPKDIFKEIEDNYSIGIFEEIKKVMLITGLARNGNALIDIIKKIVFDELYPRGFSGNFSVVSTQIRTEEHMKLLSNIDNTVFDFPIECFSRRNELLGPIKGMPFNEMMDILLLARKYFKHTRVNYIVGIDDYSITEKGFTYLKNEKLVDDVIATIFTPFSPEMKSIVHNTSMRTPHYIFAIRELLESLGFTPKRKGVKKSIFNDSNIDSHTGDIFIEKDSTNGN